MITFTEGNLLNEKAEALVNTVNTVGVMGKGIALMFKEQFPDNFRAYALACKRKEIKVGSVFAFHRQDWVGGPKWIINFPTKNHWRSPSKIEWVEAGLYDLRKFIIANKITSVAIPPLGSGNGGLDWDEVRPYVYKILGDLDASIIVYEPTSKYQNIAKRNGIEKLTPARAIVAELIKRYVVLGFDCTLLEVQKLVYLMQRKIVSAGLENPFKLEFQADKFGPYAPVLAHLLNGLDGSYLHCAKRISDAGPLDVIDFEYSKKDVLSLYLSTEAKYYKPALDDLTRLIDGFESPLGMELIGTVDWLIYHDKVAANREAIQEGLSSWLGGGQAAERKLRMFEPRFIEIALARLETSY